MQRIPSFTFKITLTANGFSNPVYITTKKSEEQTLLYAKRVYSGLFDTIEIMEEVD